jgi:branched-subunit amino acid aminotransferase/4-amino-4-deoxychorismate lyase
LEQQALRRADGVFLTNSVMGIVPVAELDGSALTMSPFVTELQSAYDELMRHETAG